MRKRGINIYYAHNHLITQVILSHLQMRTLRFTWIYLSNFVWESRPWLSDSKLLIVSLSNPFSRECLAGAPGVSLCIFVCLAYILTWEKPVKKEAILSTHQAGAAKTKRFLKEWATKGSRAKDLCWATSWRSSLSLVLCRWGDNRPIHFLHWEDSMKRASYENSKSNTHLLRGEGERKEGGNSKQ